MYNYFVFDVKMLDLIVIALFMELIKETTVYNTAVHMFEYHAIKLEEMTTCMKLKIKDNVRVYHSPSPTSPSSFKNNF